MRRPSLLDLGLTLKGGVGEIFTDDVVELKRSITSDCYLRAGVDWLDRAVDVGEAGRVGLGASLLNLPEVLVPLTRPERREEGLDENLEKQRPPASTPKSDGRLVPHSPQGASEGTTVAVSPLRKPPRIKKSALHQQP
jgi:hypothetical protein